MVELATPMDIVFNPPVNEENQYIQVLVGELRAKGYRIHPLDTIFSSRKHFNSIRLVHLNWFENIDDSGFFVALRSFVRKLAVLTVIHWSGKPLIWTLHNRVSHEKGLTFFSRTITRLLIRWSHRIVIHSGQSEEVLASYGTKALQKAVYVPHPHFMGVYGEVCSAPGYNSGNNERLELLFTGMVKPYKNLELLIDVVRTFGDRVRLTIAGKALDDAYRTEISNLAQRARNVVWLPYFVPDGEVATLLAGADVIVLPYDLSSSLNSGTVLLAFSYKKTVICPEIGTISDMGSHRNDTFHYRYKTGEEHRAALTEQIARAVTLKQRDPATLTTMGDQLYAYVADVHDQEKAGTMLDNVYKQLLAEGRVQE
ncbi:glycosyltransferase family 4 protein [Parapedobacter indicus]|uniref:Glycosyltransferase involved in cell wall bisynthesis n=1 Tax=Parapedobacter indicus TaxID=1477437 RepID=A0A1I3EY12_9SPHI|nr:glycosyltransferase family 4 protein [Parapedobacter indicus]PPL03470.1 glycosyltransferase involved in cell wall biosynthesis [Parapedobacter indicus]SFI03935.1 Glycosyltransferase involved in cell wall bisynthesis [Parapedobacter indicus]